MESLQSVHMGGSHSLGKFQTRNYSFKICLSPLLSLHVYVCAGANKGTMSSVGPSPSSLLETGPLAPHQLAYKLAGTLLSLSSHCRECMLLRLALPGFWWPKLGAS